MMHKLVFLFAAFALAAAPSAADAKSNKAKPKTHAVETAKPVDTNEASWRLVKEGLPLALPVWAMPIYMHWKEGQTKDAPAKKKAHRARVAKHKK